MSAKGVDIGAVVDVVIPALNEQQGVAVVVQAIPDWVRRIVVVDNGSTDGTEAAALASGASVVHEPRRGYGAACLRGLADLEEPDVVVFMDADGSDDPREMLRLVEPVVSDRADLVIGSRVLGTAEPGALSPVQRFGNRLASTMIRRLWGVPCTDLGPFRAIRFRTLQQLAMNDLDYGWTVQMQARAARSGVRTIEVPVSYRRRIGRSKISGTIRGVLGAGTKILSTTVREALRRRPRAHPTRTLVVFSRLPRPGAAKTRLVPALGPDGAADLQRRMTERTLMVARRWSVEAGNRVVVRFTGGALEEMRGAFGDGLEYEEQGDGSLGQRMHSAFLEHHSPSDHPDPGDTRVVITGSDCPSITPRVLRQAFRALDRADVVIGPAADGGYYLIGLRSPQPALFDGMAWGGPEVFGLTLSACRRSGLRVQTLETLNDVDEPEDLPHWEELLARLDRSGRSPELSVVIPTLNERHRLEQAIASVAAGDADGAVEVIVADGGSTDGTVQLARDLGARIVIAPRGRAVQMNSGAAEARGDTLLFLHADTRLPFGYRAEIDRTLSDPRTTAGAFRLAFDHSTPSLRLIELGANLRSRWLQMPYGDQAVFLPRSTFNAVGCFRDWPAMEDFDLVHRLRRHGRIASASSFAVTSARRWRREGAWRTTIRHQAAIVTHLLGGSPHRVARILGHSTEGPPADPSPARAGPVSARSR